MFRISCAVVNASSCVPAETKIFVSSALKIKKNYSTPQFRPIVSITELKSARDALYLQI